MFTYISDPHLDLVQQEMSRHQNCKRMGMVQLLVKSIRFISEFLKSSKITKPGATRCHGTRGCKRCPSTSLYEQLSIVYSPVSY